LAISAVKIIACGGETEPLGG